MKTSLGIWAFGNMATRFNAGGYKPELSGVSTADEGADGGRGARRPDGRLRVPLSAGALAGEPRRGARGARRARHLLRLLGAASRRALRQGRVLLARRRGSRGGAAADAGGDRPRRRGRGAHDHLAGDRGLQLSVPDAVRGVVGAVSSTGSASRRSYAAGQGRDGLPRAQELRAGDEDPDAEHRHDPARDPHAARPGHLERQGEHGLAAPDHERREPAPSTRRSWPPRGCWGISTRTRAGAPSTTTTWSARPRSWRRSSSRVELRRAGYGSNGERLGFDLYPYTEDAVGAVKRSVLQWRFIDGVAAKVDGPELREAQHAKGRRTRVRARLRRARCLMRS